MPGNLTVATYPDLSDLVVTNLQSLPSSGTFVGGWSSAAISNRSNLALDYWAAWNLFTGASPTADKEWRVYVYPALGHTGGTPTWGDLFSSGTPGVQGLVTVRDVKLLETAMTLLWSTATHGTTNGSYPGAKSLRSRLGMIPSDFAFYVSHNTGVDAKSSGNVFRLSRYNESYT